METELCGSPALQRADSARTIDARALTDDAFGFPLSRASASVGSLPTSVPDSGPLLAERMIAWARLSMVAFALLMAWWHHPARLAEQTTLVYGLLTAYALYSTALLALVSLRPVPLPYPVVRHAVDGLVIAALLYLGPVASGPPFQYVAFLLVATSLRWQRRGTPWPGAAMLVAIAVAAVSTALWRPAILRVSDFIAGGVSLLVTAVLLAKLGASKERGWPSLPPRATELGTDADDWDTLIRDMPRWAAQALGTSRALITWEESDEPRLCLASFDAGASQFSQLAPGVVDPMVPAELIQAEFFCRRVRGRRPSVFYWSPEGFKQWQGPPLHPVLQALFAVTSVLSVKLEGETVRGRLFWFDKPRVTSADIPLAEAVARQVADRMDRVYLQRRLTAQAIEAERVRMGRDLHDGALHALAGVALELENLLRRPDLEVMPQHDRLRQMQRTLETQQRDLRMVIERLRGKGPAPAPDICLSVRVKDLVDRIERQRGVRVEWDGATALDALATDQDDVFLLLHEALTNAARHSGAAVLRMSAVLEEDGLAIVVADDGHGFPFKGRYDLRTLGTLGLGPVTLRERVTRLGGRLTIDSTNTGSRLDVFLPIAHSAH